MSDSKEIALPSKEVIKLRHFLFKNVVKKLGKEPVLLIIKYIGTKNPIPKPIPKNINGTCKICMEPIKSGDRAAIWCFHPFCRGCLSEWYNLKNECPLCKQPFCISCGLNPKMDIKEEGACKCLLRTTHKNATTCNFCGVWGDHDEADCPRREPALFGYIIMFTNPRLDPHSV